jgi:hypothetical protein
MHAPADPKPDTSRRWLCFHEAGYIVVAAAIGITIRPRRQALRCYEGDLAHDYLKADLEKLAVVAMAGHEALARVGGGGDRDPLTAGDLLFREYLRDPHCSRALIPQHINQRMTELTRTAKRHVAENWREIEALAARMAS